MKITRTLTILHVIVFSVFMISSLTYSRTIIINVSNFSFNPASVTNAVVGDTIQWTRVEGSHTTTCDGTNGTIRPAGATPWDSPLNSNNVTFKYRIQVEGTYNYVCTPHAPDMAGTIIATISSISQTNEIVRGYKLSQNYPNPFNPSTKISFSIPVNSLVLLKVYNNLGKEVETLLNKNLNASTYEIEWNSENLGSGIYYYKIETGNFTETKKMILTR